MRKYLTIAVGCSLVALLAAILLVRNNEVPSPAGSSSPATDGFGGSAVDTAMIPSGGGRVTRAPGARAPRGAATPPVDRAATAADGVFEVRVAARGEPVPGARVRAYWRGSVDPNTDHVDWRVVGAGITNPEGKAVIAAAPGEYLVVARAPGMAPAAKQAARPEGEPVTRVAVNVEPGTALVGVTVDQRTREAVTLADVLLAPIVGAPGRHASDAPVEECLAATSDPKGRFRFDGISPGRYGVRAHAAGYARTDVLDVTVPHGDELTVTLRQAGVVEGFVLAAAGTPAAGAEVSVIGGDEPPTVVVAGAGGGFSAEVPPGSYKLAARRGREAGSLPGTLVVPGGVTVGGLTIRLGAGAVIAGSVVVGATEEPLGGAAVAVSPYGDAGDCGRAVTDAAGKFAVDSLAPGSYDVVVTASGYTPVLRRGITVASGERFTLTVRVGRTGAVEGSVAAAGGAPVASVCVEAGALGELATLSAGTAQAFTDESGRYRLVGVPAGRVEVKARRTEAGYAESKIVMLREGETARADFLLAETGTVVGVVTEGRGGRPVGGAPVAALGRGGGRGRAHQELTKSDGTFVIELPAGPYQVIAAKPGRIPLGIEEFVDVTIEAGRTVRVELLLQPEGYVDRDALSGVVLEPGGAPSVGAVVLLMGSVGGGNVRLTDDQGRFSFGRGARSGGEQVALLARNGGRAGNVDDVRRDAKGVVVRLQAAASVRGRVVAEQGRAVTGFTLRVSAPNDQVPVALGYEDPLEFAADAFELHDLPASRVAFEARTADGRLGRVEEVLSAGRSADVRVPVK